MSDEERPVFSPEAMGTLHDIERKAEESVPADRIGQIAAIETFAATHNLTPKAERQTNMALDHARRLRDRQQRLDR